MNKRVNPSKNPQQCANCGINSLCLTIGVSQNDWLDIEPFVTTGKTLQKGEVLFKAGDDYTGIYIVRSGSFKLVETTQLGEERIMLFYFPGELFGFDAIKQKYHYSCIALETSSVCELSLEKLFMLAAKSTTIQKQLLALMSQDISYVPSINMNATAEQRVIKFLLILSEWAKRRGLSAQHIHLSMSREELGEYLGLAMETVTRILKKLHEKNLLKLELRDIELLNIPKLIALEQGLF